MTSLDSLQEDVGKAERFYDRQVIYANEAASKLISDVEYHIDQFGHVGQIEWFLGRIPQLPPAIQTELKNFLLEDDDTIFVRVRHCSAPFPLPDDWKPAPTPIRSEVDYSAKPYKITIYRDDDSNYELPADDARATLVFALREHFGLPHGNAG